MEEIIKELEWIKSTIDDDCNISRINIIIEKIKEKEEEIKGLKVRLQLVLDENERNIKELKLLRKTKFMVDILGEVNEK